MKSPETPVNHHLFVQQVQVKYADVVALKNVSLKLEHGQIGCLLGPSGCGKSTLLRAIAGFEPITQGDITLAGKTLSDENTMIAAERRGIGMVFQDIALFPHLTVAENVGFGLVNQTKKQKRKRITEMLELVGLSDTASRYPHSLSGGQQQRIALARALAPKPKLLLLDEPFSGLDATLKETLVPEIRRILIAEKITALLVTHDQLEAFTIADKVALMNAGVIEQCDAPYAIYHQPITRFVADFIGQGYFLPAVVLNNSQINTDLGILNLPEPLTYSSDAKVDLLIRPDDVLHDDDSNFFGVITSKQFKGTFFQYQVTLANGRTLLCIASSHHNHAIGQQIGIRLDLDHFVVFPAETSIN
jgi:iron(III) transport system ATP-binding protein